MVEGSGTKADLVAAAIRGDADAARRVWEGERRWVAAVLLAHKPRDAELDDLLQDVALSYVRTITTLRDAGAFRPWLRTVAINAARASGRKASRRRRDEAKGEIDLSGVAQAEAGGTPDLATREAAGTVLDLALGLPEGYREPLLLRCVRGMSYREISALMAIPETTVETRIARARRMVREMAEGKSVQSVKGKGRPVICL